MQNYGLILQHISHCNADLDTKIQCRAFLIQFCFIYLFLPLPCCWPYFLLVLLPVWKHQVHIKIAG